MTDSPDFERYRYNAPDRISLARTIGGTVIILLGWIATTVLVVVPVVLSGRDASWLFSTAEGSLTLLLSFAGFWVGAWLAMRFVHREPLGNLLGWSGRLSLSDFQKGFIAIIVTSVVSELLIYAVSPVFERSALPWERWLLYLPLVALGCFLQTTGEEILFRAYLVRNLANRFRSAWVWAFLPSLAFVSLHLLQPTSVAEFAVIVASIGGLTFAMVLTVYVTGNLGAAMGMHFANNLFIFLFVAHQEELSSFALFRGAQLDALLADTANAIMIGLISLACIAFAVVMLLHPASPLKLSRSPA